MESTILYPKAAKDLFSSVFLQVPTVPIVWIIHVFPWEFLLHNVGKRPICGVRVWWSYVYLSLKWITNHSYTMLYLHFGHAGEDYSPPKSLSILAGSKLNGSSFGINGIHAILVQLIFTRENEWKWWTISCWGDTFSSSSRWSEALGRIEDQMQMASWRGTHGVGRIHRELGRTLHGKHTWEQRPYGTLTWCTRNDI